MSFTVKCHKCDDEGDFPTPEMALQAKREHLCYGTVASCADMGYEDYIKTGEWP